MKRHFRPELLNRLDEIVVFDPLFNEHLRKVARLLMKDVALRLAERGIALAVTNEALECVLSQSYDPVSVTSLDSLAVHQPTYDCLLTWDLLCLCCRFTVQGQLDDG